MIMKRFAVGFAMGFITFLVINAIAAHLSSDCGLLAVFGRDACADDIVRAGWPLQFHEAGGFAYHFNFSAGMLGLDAGIALVVGIALGWLVSRRSS